MIECAMAHADAETLAEAINADIPPRPRVHVEPLGERGMPMQCRHCEDAPCTLVCPKDAIARLSPDAPVLIDADACSGCTFCVLVCPFGAVEMSAGKKPAVKCDLCIERAEAGDPPACVDACPTNALALAEIDEPLRQRRIEQDKRVAESNAQHAGEAEGEGKTVPCEICGADVAPRKQLEFVRKKLGEKWVVPNVCPSCRRARAAVMLAAAPAATAEE